MKIIAVIPARSGSQGVPHKNIKPLAGKPLLAYSIEAAQKSGLFDCIHVSTDSEEYAKIAREYGADVPFLRSAQKAAGTVASWDVVLAALEQYEQIGQTFDVAVLLQPTSPLRTAEDILGVYALYQEKKARAVISVCEMEHPPLWSNVLPEDLSFNGFIKKEANVPRQQLPTYYRVNGAVTLAEIDFVRESIFMAREGCYAYIMDKEHSVDIDSQMDFDYAEFLLSKKQEEK